MLFALGPAFVWLLLADRSLSSGERAARGVLAFAAILLALQAYPMPDGTQIVVGTVLLLPVALVTIAGAERRLGANRSSTAQPSVGRRAILATLAVAVAANIGIKAQRLYARGVPLAMPGATTVRTTERNAATYWWLSANLRENCDAFITAPGLNSLHFWTAIAPVSTLNTTLWPLLFDADQQRQFSRPRRRWSASAWYGLRTGWRRSRAHPMPHPDRSSSGCGRSSNRARALAAGNFACAAAGLRLVCTKADR